jgi:hypothetical protein
MISREQITHYETIGDITKGILGTIATTGGLIMSYLPEIEACLRIISLIVGITVGILTIVSIVKKRRR